MAAFQFAFAQNTLRFPWHLALQLAWDLSNRIGKRKLDIWLLPVPLPLLFCYVCIKKHPLDGVGAADAVACCTCAGICALVAEVTWGLYLPAAHSLNQNL